MSSFVVLLDTNIITHDRNLIILISIMISFMLCLCIIDFINLILRSLSIYILNELQRNGDAFIIKEYNKC